MTDKPKACKFYFKAWTRKGTHYTDLEVVAFTQQEACKILNEKYAADYILGDCRHARFI